MPTNYLSAPRKQPRAKASCFWLSALHFLRWNIFKVFLFISTSLYTVRDIDKCPFLLVHFPCCKIFEVPPPCQHFTFCDSRYLLSPSLCQQFTLHTAKSLQVSCLSAVWSAHCKILIGVLLPGIHRRPRNIVVMNVTITGPRIMIYSYNTRKSQQDAIFLNKTSICFGEIYCPSSGVLILYSQ